MDTDVCKKAGLNDSQSAVYLYLIQTGAKTPPLIAEAIKESRTNTYNVLAQLESLGLIEAVEANKSQYRAKNPVVLKQLIAKKSQEIQKTAQEVTALLPELISRYRLSHNQPGVIQMDGVNAFRAIYDDLIADNLEPLILPSRYDREDAETAEVIDEQIQRQHKAGISSKVLIARDPALAQDDAELAKRGVVLRSVLDERLPAQVMIYGDNVAMTTFKNGVSSTIITNPEIAETFRLLFMQLWGDQQK